MRQEDLDRLEVPYLRSGASDFAGALGVKLDHVRQLSAQILGDLDPKEFGVGWWRLPTESKTTLQQRILVSDYLLDALLGVETNLLDLQLHFLELQHAWAREADRNVSTRLRQRV